MSWICYFVVITWKLGMLIGNYEHLIQAAQTQFLFKFVHNSNNYEPHIFTWQSGQMICIKRLCQLCIC